jgi:manganese transport protein
VLAGVALLLLYIVAAPFVPRLRGAGPAAAPAAGPAPLIVAAGSRTPRQGPRELPPVEIGKAYPRIAAALELGSADEAVLAYLRSIRFGEGSELVLIHVTESAASKFLGAETSDVEVREDERAMEAVAAEFRARGVGTRVLLGHGDPAREIVRLVEAVGPDLLITGGHGHGWLADLFYGSTAAAVRHRVRCAVLNVPSGRKRR